MKEYIFDPTKFGYLPPKRMPKALRDHLHKRAYVKIICGSKEAFWFSSCYQMSLDERWLFEGGLYDFKRPDNPYTSHSDYSGCITSERYAKTLLIHLLGTCTNKGTLKYGKERLLAQSLKLKKACHG